MNNPPAHTTTTSTTTTSAANPTAETTKPTAMEKVKEKVDTLVEKVTGRTHTDSNDPLQPGTGTHHTNVTQGNDPVATYHAGDTAVPHGNTVDRTAYGQKLEGMAPVPAPAPAVPPKDDKHHHERGVLGGQHDQHNQHHTTTLPGATQAADPNLIHPSVIPHQQTTTAAATGPGFQNPATVAGPTGTSHMPTSSQNIPPTAAAGTAAPATEQFHPMDMTGGKMGGVMGQQQRDPLDEHRQAHAQNTAAAMAPAAAAATGTGLPMNTNNSTVPVNQQNLGQTAPVHSANNATTTGANNAIPQNTATVPAMGAPGTTTATGTHMPGQYVA
ncbi:hypothetical protein BGX23_011473 [Mortierella sp. AD031]|nr:hypothetical protein BGX23_011473 [Mortierella sp. AD031]